MGEAVVKMTSTLNRGGPQSQESQASGQDLPNPAGDCAGTKYPDHGVQVSRFVLATD